MRFRCIALGATMWLVNAGAFAQDVRDTPGPIERSATTITTDTLLPRWLAPAPLFYPLELRRIGGKATVTFQVTIGGSGRIAELRKTRGPVVQPAIGPLQNDVEALRSAALRVEQAVLASLKGLRFEPPQQKTAVTFTLSVTFAAGDVRIGLAPPDEVSLNELPPSRWAALESVSSLAARGQPGSVTPPAQTKKVNPIYPGKAQSDKVQGIVVLEVAIGADGKVTDARVLRSVSELLDLAAIAAVIQWEYTPLMIDGQPRPIIMSVTTTFTLN